MTKLDYIRGRKSKAQAFGLNLLIFILLLGISFVILFPFLVKLSSAFMSRSDLMDKTVKYVPRNPTLDNLKVVWDSGYLQALLNTTGLSLMCGALQMFTCSLIGYGLAKFRFRGRGLLFAIVVGLMIIPPQAILISMFMEFKFFDIFGLFQALLGKPLSLSDSMWPMAILSVTGLGFKNGLFIFLMRQFYTNVPDELIEAAYIDGSNVYRTYFQVMMPLSKPTMVTVFLLAFSWQWTDTFYSSIFYTHTKVLSNIVSGIGAKAMFETNQAQYASVYTNAAALLVLIPLVILYIFAQRYFVQGIERSGITG